MLRAAQLENDLYEEVEADQAALGEAMAVVVLSSVAAGLGRLGDVGVSGILLVTLWALTAWFIWAYLTFFIGTKLLPEPQTESDLGETLRTIGYSSSPGLIRIFAFVPVVGPLIILVASIWMLVAMVIAVRQALDYESTLRAVGVCVIGWLVQLALVVILSSLQASIT